MKGYSGKFYPFGLVCLVALMIAVFIPFTQVSADSLSDTGQTKCYDNGGEIPCPTPCEDCFGQDAQYESQTPRSYTKLGESGVVLSDAATQEEGWIMTRDNVTGLVWEIKTAANENNKYTWDDANTYATNLTLGGRAWRMPTVQELQTLGNYGSFLVLDPKWFPHHPLCWASTRCALWPEYLAWRSDGASSYDQNVTDDYVDEFGTLEHVEFNVRAVSDGS